MKPLLLTICLMFFACSKHASTDTVEPYERVDEIASSYLKQLENYEEEILFHDRCDKLTFASLSSAFVINRDLSGFEYYPGEWHRDHNICYPSDSRSEISFDGLIGVLHNFWSSNDRRGIKRLADYGRRHGWKMGEGPDEYTLLPQIGIITDDMLGHMNFASEDATFRLESTHNDHLLALSAWLKLRYSGYLEAHDLLILKNLKRNPLITAILARVDDGSQAESIMYLSKFPDKLPLETGEASWSGCPKWLYFFLLKGILDGR